MTQHMNDELFARAQRVIEASNQRPAEPLHLHGIAECLLLRPKPPLRCFQLEEQDAAVTEHDQIGEPGMDAHADKDRLAFGPAGPGLGHLVGAVMDDGRAGQGDPQRLHDGALQIGLGGATAHHRAALP